MKCSMGSGHVAELNFGDRFACVLVKSWNFKLLFKGDDFIHIDIKSALKSA